MSILSVLFGNTCSQCRASLGKGTSLVKHVKMASGNWVKVCKRCYSVMQPTGGLDNQVGKPKYKPKGDKYGDDNPNQSKLW